MHELALAQNIVDIVEQAARNAALGRVLRVNLAVGDGAVVMPEALHTAFSFASAGTVMDGAQLQLHPEPGPALRVIDIEGDD